MFYINKIDIKKNNKIKNEKGGLTGKVVDSEGNAIEHAIVKLLNSDGKVLYKMICNQKGEFTFDGLTIGHYMIFAIKDDYMLSTRKRVTVTKGMHSLGELYLTRVGYPIE